MGVYGSKDTGNLYTSEESKKKNNFKKKDGKGGFAVLIIVCVVILALYGKDSEKQLEPISSVEEFNNLQNEVGTRKKPARIGEAIQTGAINSDGNKCIIEIELTDFKRGEEAINIMWPQGGYGGDPGEGKEYALAKFRVKNVEDVSGRDIPFNLSSVQFSYSTGNFVVTNMRWNVPGLSPDLEANLYEGAEHEGWVCFSIDKDDIQPKVVFLDNLWFDL